MILMIIEVYGPEICIMARSRGATSGLSSVFIYFFAERERTRVPDVIFARLVRGRAEEKRAAFEGYPVATSVHSARDRTIRG